MFNEIDWSFIDYKPVSDKDFIENCLTSKLWRMNNLYKVKNKQGNIVTFRMNQAQRLIASCKHNRKIVLKSRQQGVSTYCLLDKLDECIVKHNLTNGVMAQGLSEASELLEKCRLAWQYLDVKIKEFLNLDVVVDNAGEFGFNNNSKLMVRVSFRSGTLQNLHVSELGKIAVKDPNKAYELKTGTFQAIGDKRKIIVESTAEGKSGYFYELWDNAEKMLLNNETFSELDFYPIFLSWLIDDDCKLATPQVISKEMRDYFVEIANLTGIKPTTEQQNFYIAKRRELGGNVTQEYPSTPDEAFAAARDGSYYAPMVRELFKRGRIQPNLYDKNLPVFVAMDLGLNDDFVLLFWQMYRGENRIIHCYVNNQESLEHYVKYLRSMPYTYARFFAPHDIEHKELTLGMSRRKYLQLMGISVVVLKKTAIADGINAVRIMLKDTWIDSSCQNVIESLEGYTKQWDEANGVWKEKPLHNKHSHIADAVRYMAMSNAVEFESIEVDKRLRNYDFGGNLGNADGSYDV